VIYTVAPSPVDPLTIWAGTDDGLVHVTRDGGKTWKKVTPPGIADWTKISLIEAGHSDAGTAYAAVNGIRIDDMHPHIYKTHDGGASWTAIDAGLPDDPINVIREDPKRKGLLLAGSERNVWISFDDGAHWASLRLNMPATSIRDLVFKDADVVLATHGRSFWIMDDIAPLREMGPATTAQDAVLYKPDPAIRVRWNMNPDTPLPGDEPAGENPPDGAVIDYYLKGDAAGPVTLEVADAAGKVLRRFSSTDTLYEIPDVNIPPYWIRTQQILSAKGGPHRVTWDLHEQPLNVPASYPISAVVGNTAPAASSPWVMPGAYTVRLLVNGKTYTQKLTVKMDPRVKTPVTALQEQYDLALQAYRGRDSAMHAYNQVHALRADIAGLLHHSSGAVTGALQELDAKAAALEGAGRRGGRGVPSGAGTQRKAFSRLQGDYAAIFTILEEADLEPTAQAVAALHATEQASRLAMADWTGLERKDLPALNAQLKAAGLETLTVQP